MNKVGANKIIKEVVESDNFRKAFIHKSYQNEKNLKHSDSYECLEFLGDSILSFCVSLFIYEKYPNFSEGQMSKLKQFIVKESSLEEVSKAINLEKFLKLGKSEEKNGGLKKTSILADVFESLLGAIYLEKGEKKVRKFLNFTLFQWSRGKENLVWDYKTKLQEFCQSEKNVLSYRLIDKPKSDNKNQFIVEVYDELKKIKEVGRDKTKKGAEQKAAYKAMKKLRII